MKIKLVQLLFIICVLSSCTSKISKETETNANSQEFDIERANKPLASKKLDFQILSETDTTKYVNWIKYGISLYIPKYWNLNYSLIQDSSNQKIVELAPGLVTAVDPNLDGAFFLKQFLEDGDLSFE